MKKTWLVQDNILCYYEPNNQKVIPCAEEIYTSIGWQEEIKIQIPRMRFSRISGSIMVDLFYDAGQLHCMVKALRHDAEISIPNMELLPDHCVHDNTWFFLSNITPEVLDLLKKWGPKSGSAITMGQYLNLLKELRGNNVIPYRDSIAQVLAQKNFSKQLLPAHLSAPLFSYQSVGFNWLNFMVSEGCGCVLGDEMGLGKTLQIVALFSARKAIPNQHFLVVAPVTLLENWRREIAKFAPNLKVLIHQGSKRTGRYKALLEHDVVVASYSTAVSDVALLNMVQWNIVALDEAQNIKNPLATRTKIVKAINRQVGIAITGTPFENHMTDLWSLVDYIAPGFLGTLSEFNHHFNDDTQSAVNVEPLLTPIMIRRRVSEVAKDLPERIDIPEALVMSDEEVQHYETERLKITGELYGQPMIAALQKLRMYCAHPFLLQDADWNSKDPTAVSLKYQRFCELLEEIFAREEKVIVFTSYTKMFAIFESDVSSRFGVPVFSINGSTPAAIRQTTVDVFSEYSGAALLVLNPRAAGTGLNITSAHYIIHYNPEWNPAVEDQASARAYRRGQENTVFVYRLFYLNTVEQIINERIENKRDISELAVIGTCGKHENRAEIVAALQLSPRRS